MSIRHRWPKKKKKKLGRKAITNLDSVLKKQRHHFDDKSQYSQNYVFFRSHVWMWELDLKECWVPKNWCFQSMVLKKILEGPLDCKEIKAVHPKGNQPWIFIGRTDAEVPILWSCDTKSLVTGKTMMWEKIEGKKRRGQKRMIRLDSTTDSVNINLSK